MQFVGVEADGVHWRRLMGVVVAIANLRPARRWLLIRLLRVVPVIRGTVACLLYPSRWTRLLSFLSYAI